MVNKIVVVVGILVVIALGFWFLSNMTGNVITGAVVGGEDVVVNEVFRISDFGSGINEEDLNGAQNSTEPKVPYK